MHPKNPFLKDYDFDTLVQCHNLLKDFVFVNKYGTKTINFGDNNAVKALNSALLKSHCNIQWDIPEKNLCPPIPSRLNYLLHIADLVNNKPIHLLDIGTGANLIYPILAKSHFKWQCTASEVDVDSLANAQRIIDENPKLANIQLRLQPTKSKILENVILPEDYFDVVVCNPPFFKNLHDAQAQNQRKVKKLNLKEKGKLNFGGLSNELWYNGGEEAFIKRMIQESVQFKNQVQWFTSLISKQENISPIKRAINKTPATEIKVIDMELGNKKSRFIAWTFN